MYFPRLHDFSIVYQGLNAYNRDNAFNKQIKEENVMYSEELINNIVADYRMGVNIKGLSELYKIPAYKVKEFLKKEKSTKTDQINERRRKREAKVREMVEDSKSNQEIADAIGVSYATVSQIKHDLGLVDKKTIEYGKKKKIIEKFINEGKKPTEIAKLTGFSFKYVENAYYRMKNEISVFSRKKPKSPYSGSLHNFKTEELLDLLELFEAFNPDWTVYLTSSVSYITHVSGHRVVTLKTKSFRSSLENMVRTIMNNEDALNYNLTYWRKL